jgi:hypothetical protein
MVCVPVPLLLKGNVEVLFGVLRGPRSYASFFVCVTNFVIVVTDHVDFMPSEEGQLTETCKGKSYLQIESHWTVLTIIL